MLRTMLDSERCSHRVGVLHQKRTWVEIATDVIRSGFYVIEKPQLFGCAVGASTNRKPSKPIKFGKSEKSWKTSESQKPKTKNQHYSDQLQKTKTNFNWILLKLGFWFLELGWTMLVFGFWFLSICGDRQNNAGFAGWFFGKHTAL